ncbi:MAG TPA: hypothetical protein VGR28_13460 [Candidatus Thermoplasmatota archaeon]|nr:hypothetical protein [Candidatus Thermoplasmatota archaeon]
MRTMVRGCIKAPLRSALVEAVQAGTCPPELRAAFEKGRFEGDICYFEVGGLFSDPWPQLKPWVQQYFDIEWEKPAKDVDRDEAARIAKLHTLRAKLGLGH